MVALSAYQGIQVNDAVRFRFGLNIYCGRVVSVGDSHKGIVIDALCEDFGHADPGPKNLVYGSMFEPQELHVAGHFRKPTFIESVVYLIFGGRYWRFVPAN